MKYFLPSLRMLLFMTVVTGLAYPLIVTGVASLLFPSQAKGNLHLIGQKFESKRYFWSRPSAVGYNPLPSGGSNLGQISADLKKAVDERRVGLRTAHGEAEEPPQDLLFASASGLDPHISPEAAYYQMARVATVRNFSEEQKSQLANLIEATVEGRQFGILGEPRVNVLELNLALDRL